MIIKFIIKKLLLLVLFFIFFPINIVFCFPKNEPEPFYKEIPYIECEVCQKTIAHVWDRINDLRASNGNKLHEFQINEVVEDLCNPETREGEWITKLDLSINKKEKEIHVIAHEEYGHCKRECQTIVRACQKNIDEVTIEIGEVLWKKKYNSKDKLIAHVCKKWTKACPEKRENRLLLPNHYHRKDEIFKEKTDKDREMDQMMKKMKAAGLGNGAQMYSRDDIENMNLNDMYKDEL